MDMDDAYQSDQEPQPEVQLLDDDDGGDWRRRERSPTPVYNDDSKSKPRKRLIKKTGGGGDEAVPDFGLGDEDLDDPAAFVGGESDGEYPNSSGKKVGEKEKKKKVRLDKREKSGGERREKFRVKKRSRDVEGDKEVKEMWDTIAGGDSEVCFLIF